MSSDNDVKDCLFYSARAAFAMPRLAARSDGTPMRDGDAGFG